jgi:hypothetical protein
MARGTERLPDISLDQLREMMRANGVVQLLVKELALNDNARNQLYLSGSMDVANIIPFGKVRVETTEKGNQSLKAPLLFNWLQPDGKAIPAPGAQIILYPQYPEVRMSGFLKAAVNAPASLMNTRIPGRLLFFGLTATGTIVAWAAGPQSNLKRDYGSLGSLEKSGVFFIVPLFRIDSGKSTRDLVVEQLYRIHLLDWIESKSLRTDGSLAPCTSTQCVGYTLEAEFGVARNSISEPDFKGWEIKASKVKSFGAAYSTKAVTLMTPEPTGGFYRSSGVQAFVRKFGYIDKLGREDRLNFGGIFRVGNRHAGTGLTLLLNGFDDKKGVVTDLNGSLALVSDTGEIASEWNFAALMSLWKRKHAQAVYVPAEERKTPSKQYRYGSSIRLGVGTDFLRLLRAISSGTVYYDPGIKLENASSTQARTKRRSQFRVKSQDISTLYEQMTEINVLKEK